MSPEDAGRSAERRPNKVATPGEPATPREPGAKQPGIADADKIARTGKVHEQVRNTPPAGDWNDVA